MSDMGPELPPHLLAKRKRKQEEEEENEDTTASGAKRSPSPSDGEKRRRVMGPAMLPAPLDERPSEPANQAEESDSDDDDGFGPALPPTGADVCIEKIWQQARVANSLIDLQNQKGSNEDDNTDSGPLPEPAPSEQKPKRDDWMMMPPQQDDLAARMDPSKQRARGFNTGKGARAPNAAGGDNSTWNETPEQKQKRLADEMMGISKPSTTGPQMPSKASAASKDEAAGKKIKERTVCLTLPPSLAACKIRLLMQCAGEDPRTIVARTTHRYQGLRGRR